MDQFRKDLKKLLSHPFVWIGVGVCLSILALVYQFSRVQHLHKLHETALFLKRKEHYTNQQKNRERNLLKLLKTADRDYVEKEIENLQFLTQERGKLRALLLNDPQNESFSKRLAFLESAENSLHFREQNFESSRRFQEVEMIQDHPVEMNREDLQNVLARIENQPLGGFSPAPNPPDLLIKKFELRRKSIDSEQENFLINIEFIKREMIHE